MVNNALPSGKFSRLGDYLDMQTIRIECKGSRTLDIDELNVLQADLKDLSPENFQKLKKEILDLGFSEPTSVWLNDGKWWLLNGTQRYRVLSQLRKEGWDIPPIPVSEVQAKNIKEAKKKILSLTSQYGEITSKGLFDFMNVAELKFEDISDFRFPEISIDEFRDEFFKEDPKPGEGDEDSVPEVSSTTIRLGDAFMLGAHKLVCGDSTDKATVERLMSYYECDCGEVHE